MSALVSEAESNRLLLYLGGLSSRDPLKKKKSTLMNESMHHDIGTLYAEWQTSTYFLLFKF